MLQIRSEQACQRLLDMTHTHGNVKPIQNVRYASMYCCAHRANERGIAIAEYDHLAAGEPTLSLQSVADCV